MSNATNHGGINLLNAPYNTGTDYLQEAMIPIVVRNETGQDIFIEDVALTFETDYAIPEIEVTEKHRWKSSPVTNRATDYENVVVRPSLLFKPFSNYFAISVTYRSLPATKDAQPVTQSLGRSKYLIIKEPPIVEEAHVFVSFKDPEDWKLAELAATFLRRAGFKPYFARNDERTGSKYWTQKIYPAIKKAKGTLVIWTTNTKNKPKVVLCELNYSKKVKTSVGLFLQRETNPPKAYPKSAMEHLLFDREEPWVPFVRAIEAATKRWREGRSFFS